MVIQVVIDIQNISARFIIFWELAEPVFLLVLDDLSFFLDGFFFFVDHLSYYLFGCFASWCMCQSGALGDLVEPPLDDALKLLRMLSTDVSEFVRPQLLDDWPWKTKHASGFVPSLAESLNQSRIDRKRTTCLAESALRVLLLVLHCVLASGTRSSRTLHVGALLLLLRFHLRSLLLSPHRSSRKKLGIHALR